MRVLTTSLSMAILASLAVSLPARGETRPVVYRGKIDWYAHRHTFAALQGIVNRDGPVLYRQSPFHYHAPVNAAWLAHYSRSPGLVYERVDRFDALVQRFRPHVKGLIGFDSSPGPKMAKAGKFFPVEEYLATSAGALASMLPVPSAMREDLSRKWGIPAPDEVELIDYRGNATGISIHGDLGDYGFGGKAEAIRWALEVLFPHCSPDYFYNLDHSDVDFAVQHRALCTNLRYTDEAAGGGTTERQLLEEILAGYRARRDRARPYFWVIGLQPPERDGVMTLSRFGGVNTMTNMGQNWSFHTRVPCSGAGWRQKPAPARPPVRPNTRYVAFIASECTTQKAAGDGMQHGAWLDQARGAVAINWGMCAAFASQAPAVVDYYYSTATANDYFVTGDICAGMGFAVPPLMPPEAWQAVLEDAAPLWRRMDLRCIDVYANDGYYDAGVDWPQFADMCDALDVLAVTAKNRVLSRGMWSDHLSTWGTASRVLGVIHYPRCPAETALDEMADFLFEKLASGQGPWGRKLCCIYLPIGALTTPVGGPTVVQVSPTGLARLQERLNTQLDGAVRIVRLDELAGRLSHPDA